MKKDVVMKDLNKSNLEYAALNQIIRELKVLMSLHVRYLRYTFPGSVALQTLARTKGHLERHKKLIMFDDKKRKGTK